MSSLRLLFRVFLSRRAEGNKCNQLIKQKYMKQKENRKKTYVSPKAESVRMEQDLLLTPFSGDHKDAPDDGQPLNARRIDSFGWEDEEDDGESSGRQLNW